MSTHRTRSTVRRKRQERMPEEVLVALRSHSSRKPDRIALQWLDGAGELHYETLSPAQSWPFLN